MVEGYVLVEAQLGRALEIERRFEEVDETIHADLVTGCYDVLARVRGESIEDLMAVTERMKAVEGVTRTLLCPVTHEATAAHRGWQPLHAAV